MAKPTRDELVSMFTYHAPRNEDDVTAHEDLRECCFATALYMVETLPDCDELFIAIDKIREAMMWGNAGLALHRDG